MSLKYRDLDATVRGRMLWELQQDQAIGKLYISPRLTREGARAWPEIMRKAIERHDDAWLADQLRSSGYVRTREQRCQPGGGIVTVKTPNSGPEILAEGEFNRFYIRGLCVDVLASGGTEVEVSRGKQVGQPRPESQAMVGWRLPARRLLEDLRSAPAEEAAPGMPPGPNSGLTVRRT